MKITRRATLSAIATALILLGAASAAQAAGPYQLVLDQGAAFSLLGHSCGGIQEESFATGFGTNGYPEGDVYLKTRCGGSGRGGGYKTTTYSAWATVEWTWFGETRSDAKLEGVGPSAGFEAIDAHGDRIYDSGTAAYLETGEPPLQPAAPPSGVSASVYLTEAGEGNGYLSMSVGWTLDPTTAHLVSSSTVTARPAAPGPPVLTATASGSWTSAVLAPAEPNTKYIVTVTSTDAEGTSEPSEVVEVTTPNSDGEGEGEGHGTTEVCEAVAGTIKLSPGLSETPHVQNITLKGTLNECDGPLSIESAKFTDHLSTTEEVTCAALTSVSAEPTTTPTSLSVKWAPKGAGVSEGALVVPITESGAAVTGLLEGGPFSSPTALNGTLYESFVGGYSCGLSEGTKKGKIVKSGTFSGTTVEIG